jgi:mono/diheme cytochrome c family protein
LRQPTSLAFDEREKTVHLKPGEQKANFQWAVTNTSTSQVTVLSVFTSCGCTAAQLPTHPNPWVLKPGEGGHVGATMDVAGKFGTVAKMVTVVTSEGSYPLMARSVIPPEAADAMRNNMNRSRNLQVAAADRQAVFRGDCATCHVHPTIGKSGKELYNTACGICHEAEHRASMVTYLRDREGDFNRDYWEHWIRNGKEGSLMPAFESGQGGPLSDEQVQSLTDYLVNEYPLETNFPGKTSQEPPPSY